MGNSMNDFMGPIYKRIGKYYGQTAKQTPSGRQNNFDLMRRIKDASCFGKITGSCGETIEIYLKVDGERIIDASFVTDGCGFSVLCGYIASRLAMGRSIDDAIQIERNTILVFFEEVPENDSHCAYLAAEALQSAIHNWMVQQRKRISAGEQSPGL